MKKLGIILFSSVLSTNLLAQSFIDFGGYQERQKGDGDMEPPHCQMVFRENENKVLYFCEDNYIKPEDIESELFAQVNGNAISKSVFKTIGFPAGVELNADLLGVKNLSDAFPIKFKLVARDKAGNAAINNSLEVNLEDSNDINTCSVEISPPNSDSSNSLFSVSEARVSLVKAGSEITIKTQTTVKADPCDFSTICDNSQQVTFSLNFPLVSELNALNNNENTQTSAGSLTINPGNQSFNISGSYSEVAGKISSIDFSGVTQIDKQTLNVKVTCLK